MEIVGKLTGDAKASKLKNERQVVNFSVAVNDWYRPKDNEQMVKITNYFNCSYWINPAVAPHLTKGTLVELNGRISVNGWINANGEAKASLNFHVNSIKLHRRTVATAKQTIPVAAEVTERAEDLPF